jgi:hypothetical protein
MNARMTAPNDGINDSGSIFSIEAACQIAKKATSGTKPSGFLIKLRADEICAISAFSPLLP